MLGRARKALPYVAAMAFLLLFFGIGIWKSSHPPQSPSQSRAAPDKPYPSYKAQKEVPEEAIARYNEYLAWFTAILALATIGLGIGTVFQIRLARAEFAASHRPKIRIKHVWLVQLGSDMPVTVDIVYVNVGDANAVISSIGMDFNIINLDAQLPPDMTPPGRPYVRYPECGLGVTVRTGNVSSLGRLDDERVQAIRSGAKLLCCFGFIEYSDTGPNETRKVRRTAFCRVYKPSARPIDGLGRFVRPEKPDSDYEYED
jgi:hypothetical protein